MTSAYVNRLVTSSSERLTFTDNLHEDTTKGYIVTASEGFDLTQTVFVENKTDFINFTSSEMDWSDYGENNRDIDVTVASSDVSHPSTPQLLSSSSFIQNGGIDKTVAISMETLTDGASTVETFFPSSESDVSSETWTESSIHFKYDGNETNLPFVEAYRYSIDCTFYLCLF